MTLAAAKAIIDNQFVEVIIAPSIEDGVLEATAAKKNVRVLVCGELPAPDQRDSQLDYKRVNGGLLVQEQDLGLITANDLKIVTDVQPTEAQIQDIIQLECGKIRKIQCDGLCQRSAYYRCWCCVQWACANSARIAAIKAEHAGLATEGAVMASDAFFPFP